MNAFLLTFLTRTIVCSVVLSTLWLANATDQVDRRPRHLAANSVTPAQAPR
jgi:hypothetical protein